MKREVSQIPCFSCFCHSSWQNAYYSYTGPISLLQNLFLGLCHSHTTLTFSEYVVIPFDDMTWPRKLTCSWHWISDECYFIFITNQSRWQNIQLLMHRGDLKRGELFKSISMRLMQLKIPGREEAYRRLLLSSTNVFKRFWPG